MVKFRFALMIVAIISFTSVASAELLVDDFSISGNPATLSVGSGEVEREHTSGADFNQYIGFSFQSSSLVHSFGYQVVPGDSGDTFGDLGDFSNGVRFSSTFASEDSNFTVTLFGDGTVLDSSTISSGVLNFFVDVSDYKSLSFGVGGIADGGAILGGKLSAIPEPTALLLVGMGVSTVAFRRRRRVA